MIDREKRKGKLKKIDKRKKNKDNEGILLPSTYAKDADH